MKQIQRYKEDIRRFGVILTALVSALILFWHTRTLVSVILSFIVIVVLTLLLFKVI